MSPNSSDSHSPVPVLVKERGVFCARWSRDDAVWRAVGRSPLEFGGENDTADDAFLAALRRDDPAVRGVPPAACEDLAARVAAFTAAEAVDPAARRSVAFTLVPPADGRAEAPWTLSLKRYPKTVAVFRALGQACQIFPPLRNMSGRSLTLSPADAARYLGTGAAALRAAGYGADVPASLAAGEVSADIVFAPSAGKTARAADDPEKAKLTRRVTIRVAGEKVTREEIAFLLDQGASLVFFRGRWIEVDRAILKNALKVLDEDVSTVTAREAFAQSFGFRRPHGIRIAAVRGKGWFGKVLDDMRRGPAFKTEAPPAGFKGRLRAYQKRGFSWLSYLATRGFGPLLADDMGLGKTVQVIAWLLAARQRKAFGGPVLVVAPVSVTTNWMREFARFAPKMRVLLQQGPNRVPAARLPGAVAAYDVIVTGYPLFVRDFRAFSDCDISALVLDEAQMIKNPDTAVARAARAFPCDVRAALTGTPFENSAMDVWSIEEFLNPNLLGPRADFRRDFAQPIREDAHAPAAARLRRLLEPFLLRRLKTDSAVAAELGPKREIREYCVLSDDQRVRYEAALFRYGEEMRERRAQGGGTAADRGRALALLTELKLVCDGFDPSVAHAKDLAGGKVERLDALLEDIASAGESCLVFTQYVRVAEKLRDHIRSTRGGRVFFLHGGMTVAQRTAEIDAFNRAEGPAVFLLSLKAGGYGLNLVRASHVIHFDRWWNPAVENQATDRAHRLGQTKTVFVHLFISAGTLEDHIDALLESKRKVANDLVVSGEAFLARLGEREFGKVVSLS